ncbi:hypothetical protein QP932_10700 [Corynebacterium freneyi]|uniref:hypothetical protein n=1 Tax=Corynebacterium freneyi TaxID=134034 RepID=UPI00254FD24F|nr:hypothetical protein [Corynebacterium freneyi]MDK8768960.1 hypothetical protein [Corynebacterium freneyi]
MENADDQQFMGVPAYLSSGLSPISRSVLYRWLRDGTLPPRRNRRGGYLVIHEEVVEAARRAAQEPVGADPLSALSPADRDAARDFVARAVAAAPPLGPEAMTRVAAALGGVLQQRAAAAPAEIAGAA